MMKYYEYILTQYYINAQFTEYMYCLVLADLVEKKR